MRLAGDLPESTPMSNPDVDVADELTERLNEAAS
jgi:hypothetical protein